MARAITSDELVSLRTDGQLSKLYLAVLVPATVYSARINQSFSAWDSIAELTYDGGSGTLGNVLPGMSLWVGSAAGLRDRGICRIRATPSGTVFYINETSEVKFQDNDYITIKNEFSIWPRQLRVEPVRMDYDVAYTDQHLLCDPVPVLGPSAAVLWLTGATVSLTLDGSNSWVLGSSISSYAWVAPGSSSSSNMGTATPTVTYNATGIYRIDCTIAAVNGKVSIGHRYVFVYSDAHPPVTQFTLTSSLSGSYDTGGWGFDVTLYDQATIPEIYERTMVVLFSKDYYQGRLQSIGPIPGYENILAIGWVTTEDILWDPVQSSVKFHVEGPQWWFDQMTGFPVGTENTQSTPTDWTQFKDLTVDGGIWHMLHWRTTADLLMDIYPSGDTKKLPSAEGVVGTLWSQLDAISDFTIIAKPLCDRYGRLFCRVDSQYVPEADRTSFPEVQAILGSDWEQRIEFSRNPVPQTGVLEISGVSYDGTTGTPLISQAPGTVFRHHGRTETRDQLLFQDQAQANTLCGLMLNQMNNEYPLVRITLAEMNRMIDITPNQYVTLTIVSGDTPRGIVFTSKRFLARRVEFSPDSESGFLVTSLECEAETFEGLAVTVPVPQTPDPNIPPDDLPLPPYWPDIPPINPYPNPPIVPPPPDVGPCADSPANGPFQTWCSGEIDSTDDYPLHTCWIRGGLQGGTNPTTVIIDGCAQSSDDNGVTWEDASSADMNLQVKAVGPGEAFISYGSGGGGSGCGQYTFTFSGSGEVGGFQVNIDSTAKLTIYDGYTRVDAAFDASGGAGHWTYAPLTFPMVAGSGQMVWKAVAFQGYGGGADHKFNYMDAVNAGLSPTIFFDSSDFTVTEGQWNISGSDVLNPNWNADMDALFGSGWTTKGWPGHDAYYDGSYVGYGSIKIHEPDIPVHGEGTVALIFKGMPRIYRFVINEMYVYNLCQEA